jgi:predicted nucleic acid-binding protein
MLARCSHHHVDVSLLNDAPALFAEWRAIVDAFACHGKVAHDARYVAAMRTLGVTRLLTFNHADFTRFSDFEALDPAALIGKSSN